MNRLRTKITVLILLLVSYASAVCAAAQFEQPSLWQRTKNFVAEYPVTTGLIGTAAAAGVYDLAARKLELPTLGTLSATAIEKIKTEKESQLVATGVALAGAYSLAAKPLGLPTIHETIKKDLITGSEGANESPALVYHVLHGIRVFMYAKLLSYGLLNGANLMFPSLINFYNQDLKSSENICKNFSFAEVAVLGPVSEELLFTHAPYYGISFLNMYMNNSDLRKGRSAKTSIEERPWLSFLNKSIGFIIPSIFACQHDQYGAIGQMCCFVKSFLYHRSYQARSEYPFSTIIAHMLNNGILYGIATLSQSARK